MLEPEDMLSDFIHEVCLYIFRNHSALSGTVNDLLLNQDDVGRRPDNVVEDRGLSITNSSAKDARSLASRMKRVNPEPLCTLPR